MTDIKIIPGTHCNKEMYIGIGDVRDNEDDPNSVHSWIIFGKCDVCHSIFVCEILPQINKPILGVDYLIDYKRIVKGENLKVENDKNKQGCKGDK